MQSEELIENVIDKAVASLIDEHPMGHWRGDQVKEVARRAIAALSTDAEPVVLTDDEKHIGVIRSSVETGSNGKPDSRVSVKQWQDNDNLITVSMFIGNHQWVEGNFTPEDAAKIASLIATKPAVAPLYEAPPAPSVAVKALIEHNLKMIPRWKEIAEDGPDGNEPLGAVVRALEKATSALSAQVQDKRTDDDEETYQIGVRDGYSQAVQEIDRLTGGDGEYRYCTDHDPERHTPGPAEMIQRIVDRFETLNLIDDAEKRGDFWDAPGSAQVQDVAAIRAQAVEDVLSALTAHELYQYRPKAFKGFIDYARSALQSEER